MLRIIKTEPALITGLLQSILALIVGLGAHLTAGQTGALLAATTAVLALIAAASTRPFHVAALTGTLGAIITLLVAFGVKHVSVADISTINAVVVALAALLLRMHVSPVASLNAGAKVTPARM